MTWYGDRKRHSEVQRGRKRSGPVDFNFLQARIDEGLAVGILNQGATHRAMVGHIQDGFYVHKTYLLMDDSEADYARREFLKRNDLSHRYEGRADIFYKTAYTRIGRVI